MNLRTLLLVSIVLVVDGEKKKRRCMTRGKLWKSSGNFVDCGTANLKKQRYCNHPDNPSCKVQCKSSENCECDHCLVFKCGGKEKRTFACNDKTAFRTCSKEGAYYAELSSAYKSCRSPYVKTFECTICTK